jgi:predicted 3-demethylubiquinone-9 3-methyltransferase (glyoxalase superfamily)
LPACPHKKLHELSIFTPANRPTVKIVTTKQGRKVQKITTFLWFDNSAEEAAQLYVSLFKNSKITKTVRYGETGPGPKGTVMTVNFQLDGQEFIALNGGPEFKFTEAVSLLVNCETQDEVDHLWERLSAGGKKDRCGWLKDRFGLSWQITPTALLKFIGDPDPEKSGRVMKAMLQMDKIDIQRLQQAYDGR